MYLYSLFLLAVTIVIAVLFAHGKREKYPLFTKMFLRTSIIAAFLALLYNLVFLQQGAIIWDVVK
jgi:branched-subunit amino acid transport protein